MVLRIVGNLFRQQLLMLLKIIGVHLIRSSYCIKGCREFILSAVSSTTKEGGSLPIWSAVPLSSVIKAVGCLFGRPALSS